MTVYYCQGCQHYWGLGYCAAFGRKRIPKEVLEGQKAHDVAISGDNGVRYQRVRHATNQERA